MVRFLGTPAKSLGGLFAVILAIGSAIGLAGCQVTGNDAVSPTPPPAWDASFRIDDVELSRASPAVARALVRAGDPGRMDAFLRKCFAGGEVRIGFIGGSITEGALATASHSRYSTRFCAFLGHAFPGTRFTEINAGIGATDSRYGCSRAQSDLLSRLPDFIVAEFAVNDDPSDSAGATATMEGLIRKCLAASNAPVLLFHTMNRGGDSLNHSFQEHLARHYDLPVVSLRNAMWPEMQAGRLRADAFLQDYVHPNDVGHRACAYLLFQAVYRAASAWNPAEQWVRNPMPKPRLTDFHQRSGLMEAGDSALRVIQSRGWTKGKDKRGRDTFTAKAAGAYLELDCAAQEVYVGFKKSKDLDAALEITVDGAVTDTLRNAFPEDWGGGYTRFDAAYSDRTLHVPRKVGLRLLWGASMTLEALIYSGT